MKNTGKRYNDEFKTDIIRLIREDKRPVSSIVKDFGISEQTVRNWLKDSKDSKDPDKVRIAELESELKETKKRSRRNHEPNFFLIPLVRDILNALWGLFDFKPTFWLHSLTDATDLYKSQTVF